MLLIKTAFAWIKGNVIKVLLGLLLVAFILISYLWNRNDYLKHDRNRIKTNFEQVTQENSVLNTTVDELEYVKTKMVAKYDSVILANKIKPKQVKSATIIQTQYKDTIIEKIVYLPSEKQPDDSYIIPITSSNGCWGLKGEILTNDPETKFNITEKTFNNSHQLIVTPKKKFLFWTIKPEKYQLFNDCGEGTFTQINIVKR